MYDKNYLTYDEIGLKHVHCMRCNEVIKNREITEQTLPNGEKVNVFYMKTYSHARRVPYVLDDGSITHILMCIDCEDKHVETDEEKTGMTDQLKRGWIQSLEKANSGKVDIDKIKKSKIKVKQKER